VKRSRSSFTPDYSPTTTTASTFVQYHTIAQPESLVDRNPLIPDTFKLIKPETNRPSDSLPSRTLPSETKSRDHLQNYPLPQYHPDLPPINRMKRSKAFYDDLQDRFIIAGFDEERFSCWCHVEKEKRNSSQPLSVKHVYPRGTGGVQPYTSAAFFIHADKCKFYKVCCRELVHSV
jgi:hypothetical protein